MEKTKNYKINKREEKNRVLVLDIEVEKGFIETFKSKAIKRLGENIEVKGFRKGMAPEKIVVEKIGDMKLLEEQAYQALYEIIPQMVLEEKIDSIATPQINITKIANGSNLEVKTTFVLMPIVALPDYKKIAKDFSKEKDVKISEKEVNEYIDYVRKSRADAESLKKKTHAEDTKKVGNETTKDLKDGELPELNDEFVKTLGEFKNVDDFKKQLRENMQKDKEMKEHTKHRTQIIEKIIEESKIDIPEILVQEEQTRMLNQYEADITKMGIKFDEYLRELKKTKEGLKKEWYADAVKRAKMNLVLPEIAKKEKIMVDNKRLDEEVKQLVEQHPEVDEQQARVYLSHILTNEKVFEFLESLS